MTPEEVVRAELGAWNRLDVDEVMRYFAPDAVWEPEPNKMLSGYDEIHRAVSRYLRHATSGHIEIVNLAVSGNVVLIERVDRFVFGVQRFEAGIMGAFETTGDRIVAWRDYFVPPSWGPIPTST
jgi:limonene-1,2-epoxide hydrolase